MRKSNNKQISWQHKANQFKRIAVITLVAILTFSIPAVSNVVGSISNSDVSVVHAQANNLMIVNETLTTFYVNHNDSDEHWAHNLRNDGEMKANGPEFDLTDLTYIVKFPEELSHLLEDRYVLDYLQGKVLNFGSAQRPFMVTGFVHDETGERITLAKDKHKPYNYISINQSTNSIEFDFTSFYEENNIEPYIRQNVSGEYFFNNLGFEVPIIVPDSRMLYNGTYEFKTAIVRGKSVDLNDVENAHSEMLVVDYSTDPEPEEPEEVDTSELERLLAEVEDLDPDAYTDESFTVLAEAISDVEEVLTNEEANQEEVDAAVLNLKTAIDGLVAVDPDPEPEEPGEVDTSKLEQLLTEIEKLDPEAYTEESIMVLVEAFDEAIEVLLDPEATQEEVNTAVTNLQTAIDGLVEIDPEPEPEDRKEDPKVEDPKVEEPKEEPTEEPKDESKEPEEDDVKIETEETKKSPVTVDNDDENVLPKTATNYFNWVLAGLVMLMVGAASLIVMKRRVN